ncbi:MAG: OmpA family protein [Rhodocyclaceae bacterium]|jgi:outer membrane protein OmpA-like peptidoglycan-associated protein|nr:OmpA family protein [Rhodocyclaceae bacterium]MCL4756884.1 OmpA family protein [Rhodocyclaceae bacterium]
MKKILLIGAVAALAASGCANNPYEGEHRRTATGATIGAGAGAVIGRSVSSRGDRAKGTLIGAVVGATIGGLIGRQMDQQEADLRHQMAGTGVEVQREGDTIRLQAPENITFDSNRADIKPQFAPVLDQLATSIRQYPGTVVRIEGHTDATGSAAYNQSLSENRAQSVRSYLLQRGVPMHRVEAVGFGMTRPIADNRSEYGRALNRRVEILIIPVQQ